MKIIAEQVYTVHECFYNFSENFFSNIMHTLFRCTNTWDDDVRSFMILRCCMATYTCGKSEMKIITSGRLYIYTCYSCYDERQNTVSVCFIFFVYFKSKWVKCFLRRLDEPCGCNFSKKKKSLQFVGHLFEMICCTFRCIFG